MTRALPPVELTCPTIAAARLSHLRLAHNALAVALLASRNAPRPAVHQQAPNSGSRVSTPGGQEQQSMEALQRRIDQAEERHGLALPDSPERAMYAQQLERMDGHMKALREQLDALPSGARVYPGLRDTYTVTVPALHVRVEGVAYVADLWRGPVNVDPLTLDYDRYLGRGEHPGHEARGGNPLWIPRTDRTGMQRARGSEDWHAVLMVRLWPVLGLPELREVPMDSILPAELAVPSEAL